MQRQYFSQIPIRVGMQQGLKWNLPHLPLRHWRSFMMVRIVVTEVWIRRCLWLRGKAHSYSRAMSELAVHIWSRELRMWWALLHPTCWDAVSKAAVWSGETDYSVSKSLEILYQSTTKDDESLMKISSASSGNDPSAERMNRYRKHWRIWQFLYEFYPTQRIPSKIERGPKNIRAEEDAFIFLDGTLALVLPLRLANAELQIGQSLDFQIWCGPAMGAFHIDLGDKALIGARTKNRKESGGCCPTIMEGRCHTSIAIQSLKMQGALIISKELKSKIAEDTTCWIWASDW